MRALSASDVLEVWEHGLTCGPIQRALNLLAAVYPETPRDQLAQLPIGERDARLLALREALFGPQVACLTSCPACGAPLETAFDIVQLRTPPSISTLVETYSLTAGGCEVQFRLPNSSDMLSIVDVLEASVGRRTLFERCLQQASRDGATLRAQDVPEEAVSAIAAQMALLDPLADAQLALTCPACAHHWSAAFDIVSFLWTEIDAWAVRVLREVHQLASAYGWREADILVLIG